MSKIQSKRSKYQQKIKAHQPLQRRIASSGNSNQRDFFNYLQARMGYSAATQYFQAMMQEQQTKTASETQRSRSDHQGITGFSNKKTSNTGLPDNLKSGIENLSGYSMDDVKVHYNSSKPAQLQAHAYAQGTDIHLGSGQEKHLSHEAWHVVQQKQGRVKPTTQLKAGVSINDDKGLEKEADVMGMKSLQSKSKESVSSVSLNSSLLGSVVQRTVDSDLKGAGFAISEANNYAVNMDKPFNDYANKIKNGNESGDVEIQSLAVRMAKGFKVWAENYYNKTQAYLYEAQKANNFSKEGSRYAILGVNIDKDPDLELHTPNKNGGWSSEAIEFKASTSPNYKAVESLVKKGLQQLKKREDDRDSHGAQYSKLLLTVHNDHENNTYPMRPHMVDENHSGEPDKIPKDTWDKRLTDLLKGQIDNLSIKTLIEIRMEYNGKRYATATFNVG